MRQTYSSNDLVFKLKTLLFRDCKKNQLVRNMYGITNYVDLYEPLCRSYFIYFLKRHL